MRKIRSFVYNFIFMILCFFCSKSCISEYIYEGDQEKIAELEQMIAEDSYVMADLSNEYKETSIGEVSVFYEFGYSFDVQGETFSGKITLDEMPASQKIKLYYFNDDPGVVSADPFEALKRENEKGKSISDLLIGIVWGILFVFFAFILFRSVFKKRDGIAATKKPTRKDSIKKVVEPIKEISEKEKQRLETEKERIRKEKEDPTRFMPK